MYIVYESPLQMLCDNPVNYEREPDCMEFLSVVPTVWDTSVVLSAGIGSHVAIARKKDDHWFIGCMTGWEPLELELDFSFLREGKHEVSIWRDGINADRYAADFKRETMMVTHGEKLKVSLATGGGWVAIVHEE